MEGHHNTLIVYTLFLKYGKTPSGNACILKFLKLINKLVQVALRDDIQSIIHLLEVFLGYFVKEEADIIKQGFKRYVAEVHERSLSWR